ncbi:4Fe-4S dicluster domain-containing protein [Selenomonadales bacterium OttesenSCG-928-I06]|nr:4Fe-4S dicluster domain-containing protein [Selenomonadales bacterium OttesenSCG-928-I06]
MSDKKVEFECATYKNDRGLWATFPGLCKGCGLCIEKCPEKCIAWSTELGVYGTPRVEPKMDQCIICGICETVCPDCAITVKRAPKK